MKILVTGAAGQLGIDVVNELMYKHEIVGLDRKSLDISNLENVLGFVCEYKPEVIINAAAFTKVDACETEVEKAYKVNSIGAKNLAIAALENNCRLVHISTDFVFDGEKGSPYLEHDNTSPLNVYGHSKLLGEKFIREICPRHYILRTSWLYGKNGANFVKTMLEISMKKELLKVVDDQVGCPTNTADLIEMIKLLINSQAYGTYHTCNSGECSWFTFAKKIFELADKKDVEILPITSLELNRPAKRPQYSVMRNRMLELQFNYYVRSWEEALKDYMNDVE